MSLLTSPNARQLSPAATGLLLLPFLVLLFVAFLLPLGTLVHESLFVPQPTLEHYERVFDEPVYLRVLWRTLRISAIVTVATLVLAYPLADGRLGPAEVLLRLDDLGLAPVDYPEAGPDGLEIAPDGTLWVAEYGAGRLLNWAERRGLIATVAVPAPYVTNIAFGPDGLAAVTGSFVNDRPPLPGAVWVLPGDELATARLPEP